MRRLYMASGTRPSGPGMSSPERRSTSGASTHAEAGMFRSRMGVGGRSTVWTGVGSTGRWSAGRAGEGSAIARVWRAGSRIEGSHRWVGTAAP